MQEKVHENSILKCQIMHQKRNNRLIANTRTGKEPIEQLEPRNYYVNILKIPSDLIPVIYIKYAGKSI